MALREDVAPVPAPVPAPVAPTALAPIPMALMGWEPHIVAELDPTGFHEVPADFHAPVHLPALAPVRALTRTPVPVPVHLPAHAPTRARALTCVPVPVPVHTNVSAAPLTAPVPARVQVPPSAAWMATVDYFLAPTPVASSRQLTHSEVQNILAFLEARLTPMSTLTMAQDAAVAVGQWPDDT